MYEYEVSVKRLIRDIIKVLRGYKIVTSRMNALDF